MPENAHGVDEVPTPDFAPRPEKQVELTLNGNAVVEMLEAIRDNLANVDSSKGAVLRMIGIFHSAIGADVLVQHANEEPQVVQNLWRR